MSEKKQKNLENELYYPGYIKPEEKELDPETYNFKADHVSEEEMILAEEVDMCNINDDLCGEKKEDYNDKYIKK